MWGEAGEKVGNTRHLRVPYFSEREYNKKLLPFSRMFSCEWGNEFLCQAGNAWLWGHPKNFHEDEKCFELLNTDDSPSAEPQKDISRSGFLACLNASDSLIMWLSDGLMFPELNDSKAFCGIKLRHTHTKKQKAIRSNQSIQKLRFDFCIC